MVNARHLALKIMKLRSARAQSDGMMTIPSISAHLHHSFVQLYTHICHAKYDILLLISLHVQAIAAFSPRIIGTTVFIIDFHRAVYIFPDLVAISSSGRYVLNSTWPCHFNPATTLKLSLKCLADTWACAVIEWRLHTTCPLLAPFCTVIAPQRPLTS